MTHMSLTFLADARNKLRFYYLFVTEWVLLSCSVITLFRHMHPNAEWDPAQCHGHTRLFYYGSVTWLINSCGAKTLIRKLVRDQHWSQMWPNGKLPKVPKRTQICRFVHFQFFWESGPPGTLWSSLSDDLIRWDLKCSQCSYGQFSFCICACLVI